MVRLFIDINFSFIRQPIKLAILKDLGLASISFVNTEEDADIVLGIIDEDYDKPTIYLSDSSDNILVKNMAIDVVPIPTSEYEMDILTTKLRSIVDDYKSTSR